MIEAVICWSARNVVLVLIGTVFAIGAGLWSVTRMPLDAIPDLSDVQVILYTEYPGQAPQVTERGHAVLHADDPAGSVDHQGVGAAADAEQDHQVVPRSRIHVGKAGRAATATDPAPTEMFETVINLKPPEQWRDGMTVDALVAKMDRALQFPGVSNAWTMPIRARIDMLATGIRTSISTSGASPRRSSSCSACRSR